MRKFLALLIVALAIYVGSAISALISLKADVERGDGVAVLARMDQPELRRSIVAQIMSAYSEGQGKPTTGRNRQLMQLVGAAYADAMIEKYLTPANVSALLRDGRMAATDQTPELPLDMQKIAGADVSELLGRIRISGIRRFGVRLSKQTSDDEFSEILLEYQPLTWTIVGIRLPKSVLRELAKRVLAQ